MDLGSRGLVNETAIFKFLKTNRWRVRKLNSVGTVLGRQFKWGVFLQKSNGGVY